MDMKSNVGPFTGVFFFFPLANTPSPSSQILPKRGFKKIKK
jgi:hypothetical protein